MTTASFFIAEANDDGHEASGGWASGSFVYQGNLSGTSYNCGLRFQNVTVPQGATVDSAVLRVSLGNNVSTSEDYGDLYGDDADDSAAFSVGSRPSTRTKTTAAISLDGVLEGSTDEVIEITVTSIIQEIVDRGGWSSGNALSVFGDPAGAPFGNDLRMDGYDQSPSLAAELEIAYTAGGGGTNYDVSATLAVDAGVSGSSEVNAGGTGEVTYVDFDSNSKSDTSVLTLEVPFPAAAESGDLLVLIFGASDDDFATVPAGWTGLVNYQRGGSGDTDYSFIVAHRFMDGTEGGSVTLTASPNGRRAQGVVLAARGADPGNPIQPGGTRTDEGGSPTATVPVTGLTVAKDNSLLVGAVVTGRGAVSYSWPGGGTNIYDNDESPGGTGTGTVAMGIYVEAVDAGAVAGFNITCSHPSHHSTYLLAIAPEPAESGSNYEDAGSLTADAGVSVVGVVAFAASGSLDAEVDVDGAVSVALEAAASLDAETDLSAAASLAVDAAGILAAVGGVGGDGALGATDSATLAATADLAGAAAAAIETTGSLTAAGGAAGGAAVDLSAAGSLPAGAETTGVSGLLAEGAGSLDVETALIGQSVGMTSGTATLAAETGTAGAATLAASDGGSLAAEAGTTGAAALDAEAAGTLAADAATSGAATSALQAFGSLAARVTVTAASGALVAVAGALGAIARLTGAFVSTIKRRASSLAGRGGTGASDRGTLPPASREAPGPALRDQPEAERRPRIRTQRR